LLAGFGGFHDRASSAITVPLAQQALETILRDAVAEVRRTAEPALAAAAGGGHAVESIFLRI
jgi:hypothetical protein